MTDTIFALATAPGRAAVAVLRISGPRAGEVLALFGEWRPKRRGMRLVTLRAGGEVLDRALALWFAGPASYTGEDVAELHLHGGAAVVEAVSAALAKLGLRPAEAGEFTRRAFQNGKLDLSQAEAVADLIDAESAAQRRQALGQLDGALAARFEGWRAALIEALGLLEASVDFPDEELPADLAARVGPKLKRLWNDLGSAMADAGRGERVRDGFRIVLSGAPNAGKSRLFNALVGREAAIVTATPGTTRDVVEATMVIGGFKVTIADTAGLRYTDDPIEAEGVRRALAARGAAHLRVMVIDSSGDDWARGAPAMLAARDLVVLSKTDLPAGPNAEFIRRQAKTIEVSLPSGEGLEVLRAAFRLLVVHDLTGADFPAVTRERHARLLEQAWNHVRRAILALGSGSELAAEDVRLAARALERVTGRIDPEDVLGEVFARFCIGK